MLPLADTESHRAAALKEILNQVASRSYIHLSWSLRDKSSKSAREGFFFFFLTKADNIFSTDQPIAWSLYISPLWVWACVWVWPVCDPHCLNSCISLAPWCIRWSTLLLLPPKTLGPLSPSQFNKHHLFVFLQPGTLLGTEKSRIIMCAFCCLGCSHLEDEQLVLIWCANWCETRLGESGP